METKEISRERLPKIKYAKNNVETVCSYNNGISPLEQVLNNTDKSVYLVAMAGQGKTTTLRTLWLDYLCGKSEIPCLYIELKFLDAYKADSAIRNYISNEYKIDMDKIDLSTPVVLLLDGADELREEFRSKGWFASECGEILKKFRLVISERSYQIGVDGGKEKTSYGLDISKMQICELCELEGDQISTTGVKVEENTALYNLLKNNMMLSMYSDLKPYRVDIDQDSITAGKLIDLYFNIAFKAKFVKKYYNFSYDEIELYEEIRKVEGLKRGDCQGDSRKIYDALQELSEVFEFLKDFSIWFFEEESLGVGIYRSILKEQVKINLETIDSISILKYNNDSYLGEKDDSYYWDNEIYQGYFAACKLRDILNSLREGKPILKPALSYFQEEIISYTAYMFWNREHRCSYSSSVYLTILYACEMLDLNSKADIENFRNEVKERLAENEDRDVQSLVLDMDDIFSTYSVIKGWGFPNYTTEVSKHQFSACKLLNNIIIPEGIVKIGTAAFGGCSNLNKITLPNTLIELGGDVFAGTKIISLELPESLEKIDGRAFAGSAIERIKLTPKIKKIERGAFANSMHLKEIIIPDGLEEIGDCCFTDLWFTAFTWGEHYAPLEYINLPHSLKYIGNGAFFRCKLKKIFLPKSIERMGDSVFSFCVNLTDIYCEHEKQPEMWDKNWLDGCGAKVHWGCKAE